MSEYLFCKSIKYQFKDESLLKRALTHSSYANENKLPRTANNERLEFLGDSMLSAIISEELFSNFSNEEEGTLTRWRASLVCESSLAKCGAELKIGECLYLGRGEELGGGRERPSILADALEAIIGAIYLDGGSEAAKQFVLSCLKDDIYENTNANGSNSKDFKTMLQELLQDKGETLIEYRVEREEGPDHQKKFYINVYEDDLLIGKGIGMSKKKAEQAAAKNALNRGGRSEI